MRNFKNPYINISHEENFARPDERKWKEIITGHIQKICRSVAPDDVNADKDIYVGTPGIAFMFYKLVSSPVFDSDKTELISKALEYIESARGCIENRKKQSPLDRYGFLIGDAGYYAVAAAIYKCSGDRKKCDECTAKYFELCEFTNPSSYYVPLKKGGNELFVGRTGYLLGVRWMEKELNKTILPTNKIHSILDCVVREGREYSTKYNSPSPLMYAYYQTEYLGAAHGLSSILFTLLCFEDYLQQRSDVMSDVKKSIDWLVSTQSSSGNFSPTVDEIGQMTSDNRELVHWCHGAPGVVYLMAKAYLMWKSDIYLQSCIQCGELIWQKGLLKKGLGICHGITGNAYAFLLLYRLTNNKEYLRRASLFAEFTLTTEFCNTARTPDNPYSLYEGLAGAVCFFIDLLNPQNAEFPFMNIF